MKFGVGMEIPAANRFANAKSVSQSETERLAHISKQW
jgi:hypothetical protein